MQLVGCDVFFRQCLLTGKRGLGDPESRGRLFHLCRGLFQLFRTTAGDQRVKFRLSRGKPGLGQGNRVFEIAQFEHGNRVAGGNAVAFVDKYLFKAARHSKAQVHLPHIHAAEQRDLGRPPVVLARDPNRGGHTGCREQGDDRPADLSSHGPPPVHRFPTAAPKVRKPSDPEPVPRCPRRGPRRRRSRLRARRAPR